MVRRFGTETSPSSGTSSPTTMRKSVVFPAPLGPTRPTFSPGLSWNEASTKSTCLPYCLLILENEIMRIEQPQHAAALRQRQVELGAEQHRAIVVARRPLHEGRHRRSGAAGRDHAAVCGDDDRLREVE